MRIAPLIFFIITPTATFAQQRIVVNNTSGIRPDAIAGVSFGELATRIRAIKNEPRVSGVPDVLRAIERSMQRVLSVREPQYQGHSVFVSGASDVLLARYSVQADKPLDSTIALDTPRFTVFLFPYSEALFPEVSVEALIKRLLRWEALPNDTAISISFDSVTHSFTGKAQTWVLPLYAGGEVYFTASKIGPQFFVMVAFGKRILGDLYPAYAQYVPERFPPLEQRAKDYSDSQLWKVLGDHGDPDPMSGREQILIEELLRRGVSEGQFRTLVISSEVRDAALKFRADRVMRALIKTDRLKEYGPYLARVLTALPSSSTTSSMVVDSAFSYLVKNDEVNLSNVACLHLSQRSSIQSSIVYLTDRGHESSHYECVLNASVPASLEAMKSAALVSIRKRLSK